MYYHFVFQDALQNLKFDGNVNDMDVTAEEEFTNGLENYIDKEVKNNVLIPMDEYLDAQKEIMESQLSKVSKDQLKSSKVKKSN